VNGLGPIQRRIARAFIAHPDAELTTGFLVSWCYPRLAGKPQNNHRRSVRRAAEAVAVRVGRAHARGRGIIWIAKA
jgi:hypothetical protein